MHTQKRQVIRAKGIQIGTSASSIHQVIIEFFPIIAYFDHFSTIKLRQQ